MKFQEPHELYPAPFDPAGGGPGRVVVYRREAIVGGVKVTTHVTDRGDAIRIGNQFPEEWSATP